jgi:hypothetical protein
VRRQVQATLRAEVAHPVQVVLQATLFDDGQRQSRQVRRAQARKNRK